MRTPVAYERGKTPEQPNCCVVFSRWMLVVLNLLILFLGVGVVAAIIIFVNRDEGSKGKEIYENCAVCQRSMIAAAVIFGFVIISSLCGFIALCSRRTCLLISYAVFGFLMFLLMGAATAAVVLMREGVVVDALRSDWNDIEPAGKCRLQTTFECSGWETLCVVNGSSASDTDSSTSESQTKEGFTTATGANSTQMGGWTSSHNLNSNTDFPIGCVDCGGDNEVIAAYTITCKESFQDTFDKAFIPLVVIFSAFTVVCFGAMFVSCKLRVERVKREDEVALLNERYV